MHSGGRCALHPDEARVIVHVDNSLNVTGAYKSLLGLCESLPHCRHVWVLPRGSAVSQDVREKYEVYELPFVEISRSLSKLLSYIPALVVNAVRLRRILKRERANLLHLNDLYNLTGYLARVGLRPRVPVLVHVRLLQRSFPTTVYSLWRRWHLRFADRIVAVSKAVKRDWHDHPDVRVVYDDLRISEKYPTYRFRKSPDEVFRFVYLANYIPGKGQDFAVQAIAQARKRTSKPFTLDFFGDASGPRSAEYLSALKQSAQQLGLDHVVSFHGRTSDAEKTLKSYHAALHCSETESFGMACFEALSFGLPVASTACGGPEEMIDSGMSGLLFPVGDIQAGADAIIALIEDSELAPRLSRNARVSALRKLGEASQSIGRILEELCATTVSTPQPTRVRAFGGRLIRSATASFTQTISVIGSAMTRGIGRSSGSQSFDLTRPSKTSGSQLNVRNCRVLDDQPRPGRVSSEACHCYGRSSGTPGSGRRRYMDRYGGWDCACASKAGCSRPFSCRSSTDGVACGRYVIVFNGEIYNHLDLRANSMPRTRRSLGAGIRIPRPCWP